MSPVRLDQGFDQRQAEAQTLFGAAAAASQKAFPDASLVFGRGAHSCVGERDDRVIVVVAAALLGPPPPVMTEGASALGVLWNALDRMWGAFLTRVPYIAVGLLVFAAFIVAARIIQRLFLAAGQRTRVPEMLAALLGRLASAVAVVLGLFVAAVIVFPAFQPGDLVAGLGITSVAVGFALKDVLQNFFAGVLILWRRPFVVGDQIRSGEYEGTVEEINIRSTRLKTYDGERAVLPNGDVYTRAILVKTAYDARRVRFTVGIGYPDSIEKARDVIHRVLADTEGVHHDPGPWVYVTELAASSVNFTVYFWVDSDQATVLRVNDRVVTGIKLALDRAQIDMPFAHTVVLFHDQTGIHVGDRKPSQPPARDD